MAENNYHDTKQLIFREKIRDMELELPAYCTKFLNAKDQSKETSTVFSYAVDLLSFFRFLQTYNGNSFSTLREIPLTYLSTMTTDDIEAYLSYLTKYSDTQGIKRSNSNNTKARKLSTLRVFFKFLILRESAVIKSNPADITETPKKTTNDVIVVPDDMRALLFELLDNGTGIKTDKMRQFWNKNHYRDKAIYMLLFGTGLRISELVGIDLQHLDFEKNCVSVVRKGNKHRAVYFNQKVADALIDYIDLGRDQYKPNEDSVDALFLSGKHNRLSVRSIESNNQKYYSIISGEKRSPYTPHKCRSTFGKMLYEQTNDIAIVATTLDHNSTDVTFQRYNTIEESRKKKAAEATASFLP